MTRNPARFVIILAIIIYLPWMGLTPFFTKGEPREAAVAVAMIEQNNYVLPQVTVGDIPYKPPMLAWMTAAIARVTTGHVDEWTARMPSALAVIALIVLTGVFFNNSEKRHCQRGWLTAAMLMTAVEVWRAGTVGRVDMLLTLFTVAAIYSLYLLCEDRRSRWRSVLWLALSSLAISGAILSKGPVGAILPLLCVFVYKLSNRNRFGRSFLLSAIALILGLILPTLWYRAAWQQGGQEFLDLVIEENFGRMTGTMSYDSHIHSWPYCIGTLLVGFLPWTILFAAIIWATRRKLARALTIMRQEPLLLLSVVTVLVVFIFYCLPSSKRSVYQLPLYPFLCYITACLCERKFRDCTVIWRNILIGISAIYVCISAIVLPIYSRNKTDRESASEIEAITAGYPVMEYVDDKALHLYTLSHYLSKHLRPYDGAADCYVVVCECDTAAFRVAHPDISLRQIEIPKHRSCDRHSPLGLYHTEPRD